METKLTTKESEQYFFDALCNGADYIKGHGVSIDYKDSDYKLAKKRLVEKGMTGICREDVWMEILRMGEPLTLHDFENDGAYTRSIRLEDVHERLPKTPVGHLADMVEGNDDAVTADVILQTVFIEEVIFG